MPYVFHTFQVFDLMKFLLNQLFSVFTLISAETIIDKNGIIDINFIKLNIITYHSVILQIKELLRKIETKRESEKLYQRINDQFVNLNKKH